MQRQNSSSMRRGLSRMSMLDVDDDDSGGSSSVRTPASVKGPKGEGAYFGRSNSFALPQQPIIIDEDKDKDIAVRREMDKVLSRTDGMMYCVENKEQLKAARKFWNQKKWEYGFNTPVGVAYKVHEGPGCTRPFVQSHQQMLDQNEERNKNKELKRLKKLEEKQVKKQDGPEFLNFGQIYLSQLLPDQFFLFKFQIPEYLPKDTEIHIFLEALKSIEKSHVQATHAPVHFYMSSRTQFPTEDECEWRGCVSPVNGEFKLKLVPIDERYVVGTNYYIRVLSKGHVEYHFRLKVTKQAFVDEERIAAYRERNTEIFKSIKASVKASQERVKICSRRAAPKTWKDFLAPELEELALGTTPSTVTAELLQQKKVHLDRSNMNARQKLQSAASSIMAIARVEKIVGEGKENPEEHENEIRKMRSEKFFEGVMTTVMRPLSPVKLKGRPASSLGFRPATPSSENAQYRHRHRPRSALERET